MPLRIDMRLLLECLVTLELPKMKAVKKARRRYPLPLRMDVRLLLECRVTLELPKVKPTKMAQRRCWLPLRILIPGQGPYPLDQIYSTHVFPCQYMYILTYTTLVYLYDRTTVIVHSRALSWKFVRNHLMNLVPLVVFLPSAAFALTANAPTSPTALP